MTETKTKTRAIPAAIILTPGGREQRIAVPDVESARRCRLA